MLHTLVTKPLSILKVEMISNHSNTAAVRVRRTAINEDIPELQRYRVSEHNQLQRRGERRATINEELCGVYDVYVL